MDIVPLPTDSLYKLMALSGIAILLFSLAYPLRLASDLELRAIEVNTKVELNGFEITRVGYELDKLEKEKNPTPEAISSIRNKNDKLRICAINNTGEKRKIRVLLGQLRTITILSRAGAWIGLIMSIVGFLLWYLKVQRPADQLALKQIRS